MSGCVWLAGWLFVFWLGGFKGLDESILQNYFPRIHGFVLILLQRIDLLHAAFITVGFVLLVVSVVKNQKMRSKLRYYRKELMLFSMSLLVSVFIAEVALRYLAGFKPGNYSRSSYLKEVKNLKLLTGYEADSNGITHADKNSARDVAKLIAFYSDKREKLDSFELSDSLDLSIYSSIYYSCDIINGDSNSVFAKTYQTIITIPDSQRSDLQKGIVQFVSEPYNMDGYRSIPFRNYIKGKKKVLLLGDSFTWGGVASPLSNSFADLLLAMGYTIYNTGISGTDPEQYRAVAQKYIPLLKPDVVIVNLFTGNDVGNYERKVKPYAPVYYSTNAGNIMACPQGVYFKDMKEAYEVTLSWYKIPAERNWFNLLCSQTSITSVAWSVLATLGWVDAQSDLLKNYNAKTEKFREPGPVCQRMVGDIKRLCIDNQAAFLYVQIPDLTSKGFHLPKDEQGYADTIPYFVPPLVASDYSGIGGHFNNVGHRKYALFLQHLIDSVVGKNAASSL